MKLRNSKLGKQITIIFVDLLVFVGLVGILTSCAPSVPQDKTQTPRSDLEKPVSTDQEKSPNFYYTLPEDEAPITQDSLFEYPADATPLVKYQNKSGLVFTPKSEFWYEIQNTKTSRGLPVKTLVSTDKTQRLQIYDVDLGDTVENPAQLDSILTYLFKLEPSKNQSHSIKEAVLLQSSLDSIHHWGVKFQKDNNLILFFYESKSPLEMGYGNIPQIVWADKSLEVAPNKKESEIFRGVVLNTRGLFLVADSNYAQALKFFKKALRIEPKHIPYLINNVAMYQALNEPILGIDLLEKNLDVVETTDKLQGLLGALYEDKKQYASAKLWAEKALRSNPGNVEWLINLSDALWQLGEKVQSKNILLFQYNYKPSFRLSVYLAQTHLGLEEFKNAVDILETSHQKHQPTTQSIEFLLMGYVGLKEFGETLSFFASIKDEYPPTARMLVEKATAEYNLKFYHTAKKTLDEAFQLDRYNDRAKKLSLLVSQALGDKTNLIIKDPIKAIDRPITLSELKKLVKEFKSKQNEFDFPLVLLKRNEKFKWHKKGKWKKTTQFVYFVKNRETLTKFSELIFELNQGYSKMYVNSYTAYDTNYRKLPTVRLKDYYVTNDHNTTIHPEDILVHLPLPPHKGPMYIEVQVTESPKYNLSEFPYLRFSTRNSLPFYKNTLEIIDPPDDLNVHTFGKCESQNTGRSLTLQFDSKKSFVHEKFAPSIEEYGSGYSIAVNKTWLDVGESYYQYLHKSGVDLNEIPFAMKEQALEIVELNKGKVSEIQAIFSYVRDKIIYNNFEFNLHALIPEKAEDVNLKKYSDCKGHALLLAQLLKARGVPANLALINLEHVGFPNQPTLHQFNHMIVHIPGKTPGEDLFLDATEKFQPFRQVPLTLQGKNALILEKGKHRIASIPDVNVPLEHLVEISHHINLMPGNKLEGLDSIVLRGKIGAEFREQIIHWEKVGKLETLISWITDGYAGYWNGNLEIMDEEHIDKPLILVFTYQQYHQSESYKVGFTLKPELEWSFLRYPHSNGRKSPIYFPFEIKIKSDWHYHLSSNIQLHSDFSERKKVEHFLSWDRKTITHTKDYLHLQQNWTLTPFLAGAQEYSNIKNEWDLLLKESVFNLQVK